MQQQQRMIGTVSEHEMSGHRLRRTSISEPCGCRLFRRSIQLGALASKRCVTSIRRADTANVNRCLFQRMCARRD